MSNEKGALPGASNEGTPATNKELHPNQYDLAEASRLAEPLPSGTCQEHLDYLVHQALTSDALDAMGVRCVHESRDLPEEHRADWTRLGPGILFPWVAVDEKTSWQFRPDVPEVVDGRARKYLFGTGAGAVLNVHPWMRSGVGNSATPLVIVEGTKQYLAAVSALGEGAAYAAVGMSGCWGWSRDKTLSPDVQALDVRGRSIIVIMDADLATNPNVHDAAQRLSDSLVKLRGAKEVTFVRLPAHGSSGLDDLLASMEAASRASTLANLLASATAKLPARPKRVSSPFMRDGVLKVQAIAEDICEAHDLAIGQDHEIWLYGDGVFGPDRDFLSGEVARRLGDAHRAAHVASVREMVTVILQDRGRVIPDRPEGRWLNVANGMLDPIAEVLVPHGPEFLSVTQIPVEWDPSALAPNYEKWLVDRVHDQVDDLEESVSMMLDPSRIPSKALLLYGPSRSGKSTFQRLAAAMAGERNVSSVTLHALAENRFASANLLGKMLNTAADLSAQHVEDLAIFKMVTGGDSIMAERKGKQHFQFVNRAMMLFSANTIPSVGESSTAYLERMKPFEFAASFAGDEDPTIEEALLVELPGILVRWVRALQRRRNRGRFLPTQADVAKTFASSSDQVRLFLDENTVPDPGGTSRKHLYDRYCQWVNDSGLKRLSNRNFYARVRSAGVEEYHHRDRGWRFRVKVKDLDGISLPGDPDFPEWEWQPRHRHDSRDSFSPPSAATSSDLMTGDPAQAECSETVTTVTNPAEGRSGPQPDTPPSSPLLIGHGLLTAELEHLCMTRGESPTDVAAHTQDLLILSRLADPPIGGSKPNHLRQYYSIEALATRHGLTWSSDYAVQRATLARLAEKYPMTSYGLREHRAMGIVGQIRLSGFRVDQSRLDELIACEDQRHSGLRQILAADGLPLMAKDGSLARDPLNTVPGRAFLADRFRDLGIDLSVKPSGEPDLSKDALTDIAESLPDEHLARQFAVLVMEARSGNQVLGQVKEYLQDGRVHPFIDASQATGRFAVTRPGLTVMHKRFGREIFLPEPGHVIITADLAQIDARAVAAHCQDPHYMAMFEEGRDFHTEVAERVLGSPDLRHVAKVINHATSYGAGAALIAKTARITMDEARRFLCDMDHAYPGWSAWRRQTVALAERGEDLDNGFGRKVRPNPHRITTTAVAMVGQSCARDLLVEGLFRLDDAGLTPHMRMLIHDEVVFSVPAESKEDYRRVIQGCMTFDWAPMGAARRVEIHASVRRPAPTWGDA